MSSSARRTLLRRLPTEAISLTSVLGVSILSGWFYYVSQLHKGRNSNASSPGQEESSKLLMPRNSFVFFPASACHCDASLRHELNRPMNSSVVEDPSWIRRTLHVCRIYDLPLPRILRPNDPALVVPSSVLKIRQQDESRLREIQLNLAELLVMKRFQNKNLSRDEDDEDGFRRTVGSLATEQYEILYGKGVTPQHRQEFLARYGCTAWTPLILRRLAELGEGRGFVELGAGYGQWARAIIEEHRRISQHQLDQNIRDFVLAYDDDSRLPLDPRVYHEKTLPHSAYFGQVHHKCPSDPALLLNQWRNRNRVLLLVFPTPDLAFQSLMAYARMGDENDTVVYVGEGRGGANAGHDFFDALEQGGGWILQDVLYVEPFGSKGFEKLFIFRKNLSHSNSSLGDPKGNS